MNNLRPTGYRVTVDPIPLPNKTATGILLAPSYEQKPGEGIVLRVGSKVADVKPGDRVAYSWINGQEIEHNGEKATLLDSRELIGVLE